MDISQLTNSMAGSSGVQGMYGGGHHHHHKSISDQVCQMGSAIDNAVNAGTMTSDQASSLKAELTDVTNILNQVTQASSATSTTNSTAQTSATGTSAQTNPLSQLSDADRQKVFSELQDVRKQLHAAFNVQGANGVSGSTGGNNDISQLFSQIDTDGNGSIDQNEFTQFLAQIGANALGYNQQGNSNSMSSMLTGSSFSIFA